MRNEILPCPGRVWNPAWSSKIGIIPIPYSNPYWTIKMHQNALACTTQTTEEVGRYVWGRAFKKVPWKFHEMNAKSVDLLVFLFSSLDSYGWQINGVQLGQKYNKPCLQSYSGESFSKISKNIDPWSLAWPLKSDWETAGPFGKADTFSQLRVPTYPCGGFWNLGKWHFQSWIVFSFFRCKVGVVFLAEKFHVGTVPRPSIQQEDWHPGEEALDIHREFNGHGANDSNALKQGNPHVEFLGAVMSIPDVCPSFNAFVIFSLKSEKEGKNLFHGLMEILWDLFSKRRISDER